MGSRRMRKGENKTVSLSAHTTLFGPTVPDPYLAGCEEDLASNRARWINPTFMAVGCRYALVLDDGDDTLGAIIHSDWHTDVPSHARPD